MRYLILIPILKLMAWQAPYLNELDPYLIPELAQIVVGYIPEPVFDENNRLRGVAINDKREGLWTEWYENGDKMQEGKYQNGKQEGPWTFWYSNGQKRDEGEFRNGKKEGKWTSWYENGHKVIEGKYRNGEQDGLWTCWDYNGKKLYHFIK